MAPLRFAGVKLITVTDGVTDWSDVIDQMTYMATQMGKNAFLKELSRTLKVGNQQGVKVNGSTLYGSI